VSAVAVSPVEAGDARASVRAWLRLLACTAMVERAVRARLREEFGTTLPRFDVLAQLDAAARDRAGGLTMSELSRRLMVTNGNLTALVGRLAEERLVRRASPPHDRRAQLVSLTAAGRRALDAMTPAHHAWIDAMFAGLTPAELSQLHALLGRLRTSVRDALERPEGA